MIVKFKAYAAIKNKDGNTNHTWNRVAESLHETEKEAQSAASLLQKKYKDAVAGIHKYYILTKNEWNKEQYKGVSVEDNNTKTLMMNEGNGCVLLFEGIHFEIL